MGRKKNDAAEGAVETMTIAPRNPRAATLLMAQCHRTNGDRVAMRVRNLSETGFGGLCTLLTDFEAEEAVMIHFPHMSPVKAIIKWYAGKEAGVQFTQKLDVKRVAEARKSAVQAPAVHALHASAENFWQDAPQQDLPQAPARAAPKPIEAQPWQPPALNFGKRKAG